MISNSQKLHTNEKKNIINLIYSGIFKDFTTHSTTNDTLNNLLIS